MRKERNPSQFIYSVYKVQREIIIREVNRGTFEPCTVQYCYHFLIQPSKKLWMCVATKIPWSAHKSILTFKDVFMWAYAFFLTDFWRGRAYIALYGIINFTILYSIIIIIIINKSNAFANLLRGYVTWKSMMLGFDPWLCVWKSICWKKSIPSINLSTSRD